jgi:hypothetical protein
MTEHRDKVKRRDEELKLERMDSMWTQIYSQWDKNNSDYRDYTESKYASGRVCTKDHKRRGKSVITWGTVRNRFFKFWDKGEEK